MQVRAMTAAALAVVALAGSAVHGAEPAWVPTHPVQTGAQHRLAALGDGTVWAVVDHNRVLRSTDAGATWSPVNPLPVQAAGVPLSGPALGGSSETYVAPTSASAALAANGGVLSRTTDSGVTWTPVRAPSVTSSKFFEGADQLERTGGAFWYARGGSEVRDGCPYPIKTTPLLTSSDGNQWRRTDIPYPAGQVQEVRFVDARRGAAVVIEYRYTPTTRDDDGCGYSGTAQESGLYVTSDAGRTWLRALTCKPICNGLSWSTRDRLVAARADGRVFRSRDDGQTFRQLAPVPAPTGLGFLQALDCVGARCWASVNGAGIFRQDGSSEWTEELSTHKAFGVSIGDLAAIDRERAVAGGPTALLTRATAPALQGGSEARGVTHPDPLALTVGPWTTLDASQTWRRSVRLPTP